MRADVTAAFFDCVDTAELRRHVERGELPRPTAERGRGRSREPIWALEACRRFVAARHGLAQDPDEENVADLI